MKVVKYSAAWCSPCKMLQTIIDSTDFQIESVDIDEQFELAAKHNVRGVPTLIMFDDSGNEIKRNVGIMTKDQLVEWMK